MGFDGFLMDFSKGQNNWERNTNLGAAAGGGGEHFLLRKDRFHQTEVREIKAFISSLLTLQQRLLSLLNQRKSRQPSWQPTILLIKNTLYICKLKEVLPLILDTSQC